MANEVKTLEDGRLEVTLGTGEKFVGDALEVTTKLAEAHQHTKTWAQGIRTQNENLQAEVNRLNTPPPPPSTPADVEQANFRKYLVEEQAKGLGFSNGEEYQNTLKRVLGATEMMESQRVVGQFINARPEYPNTPEANDLLEKFITENNWDFSPQSLMAASDTLIREGKINALTADEQNAAWSRNLQASNASGDSGRRRPPPMLPSNSPDVSGGGTWAERTAKMSLDELRTEVLRNAQAQSQNR